MRIQRKTSPHRPYFIRMIRSLRRVALVLVLLTASASSAATKRLVLALKTDTVPASGFVVTYHDVTRILSATTDSSGVAVFRVSFDPGLIPAPFTFELASPDFVLANLRGGHYQWRADAVHSATWMLRTKPRVCDEWVRVMDIPRGMLRTETADDLESWYASISPQLLTNCETLVRIEQQVGSKAPWYFYEFKASQEACVDGKYVQELDWTAWYRGLLQEATGASPGKCLVDWERWWAEKGYPPIPSEKPWTSAAWPRRSSQRGLVHPRPHRRELRRPRHRHRRLQTR